LDVFRFIPGYRGLIFDEGKEPIFLLLLAFVIAFAGARGYARMARRRGWRSGNVGGFHLHHEVVGILLVLVAGVVAFSRAGAQPQVRDWCAVCFGVGAAFVLDEFALVFYLRDVYWSEEGRNSVDAAVLGLMIIGLLLVASEPFALNDPVNHHLGRFTAFWAILANALFVAVAFLKAKPFAGTAAIALSPVGWIAAGRLAKPGSPWARRFYGDDKLERAKHRAVDGFAARFQRNLVHLIGGD
jgi:Trk-type K+ transport system membrane component